MQITDLITKKKQGLELTDSEYDYIIDNYMKGIITDYQMSALLMAICLKGMTDQETSYLTASMINSGEVINLSKLKGIKVDKHSTGGVGDKTTLIVGPLVASCGVIVAKMSGRGLGYTGGTIDKLESIPGFKTNLSMTQFIKNLKKNNLALISQSKNVAIADKKIYSLRDVTATVDSIPLIVSSIMSKKIACGCDKIVLDVKVGRGALMPNLEQARKLARLMVKVGASYNKEVICLLTNMDIPLGYNIGNSLEIEEAMDVLLNKGEKNLTELCLKLASYMVSLGKNISYESATKMVQQKLDNQEAYQKFLDMISIQGGDINSLGQSKYKYEIKSLTNGYISNIDALKLAKYTCNLGSGRLTKDDVIDYTVGIKLVVAINDYVTSNSVLAIVHSNKNLDNFQEILNAIEISSHKNNDYKLIYEVIK